MKSKVGLIGYGQMGRNHARILEKISEVELYGIYDKDNKKLKNLETKVYKSVDNLVKESDLIVISSSTRSHLELIKKCIDNNKNFLVEKPISTSLIEIKNIRNYIKDKKIYAKVGLLEKYNPTINFLISENLKNILHIDVQRLSPSNQINRNKDNVLLDLTVHDFSILKKLLGKKYNDVKFNFYFNNKYSGDHVNIIGQSKFLNIAISTSKIFQQKVRTIDVLTDKALYKANLLNNTIEIVSLNEISPFERVGSIGHIENVNTSYPNIEYVEPLYSQMIDFLNEIKTNSFQKNKKEFEQDLILHEYLIRNMDKRSDF